MSYVIPEALSWLKLHCIWCDDGTRDGDGNRNLWNKDYVSVPKNNVVHTTWVSQGILVINVQVAIGL